MKKLSLLSFLMLFLSIGMASAQTIRYIAPGGSGIQDGSSWENAAPSINSILDDLKGDLIFYLKAGTYGPIKIWDRDEQPNVITSVAIYGGFSGVEFFPSMRNLSNPDNRTIIEGIDDGVVGTGFRHPALWLETKFTSRTVVDGLTLRGYDNQESLALRVIYPVNTIVSRCRFEGTNGSGNLIYVEGMTKGNEHLAIINSVIAENTCSYIAKCTYGIKFINTTIADNDCDGFLYATNNNNPYELKNCIVTNTYTRVIGTQVDVYNSVVDNFSSFRDTGIGNHSGIDFEFTSDNSDDPYACEPNQYITAGGDVNHIMAYMQILQDVKDIIGNSRYDMPTNTIDIGAYQGSQIVPMRQEAPERMEIGDSENIDLPSALDIYPTDLHSGETIYFEKNMDNSLTARIYSLNGVEVYSAQLTSPVEQVSVSCPAGIYIIIVTDDATGERISQGKIVVH